MRKLWLTLAAGAAVLSTSALPSRADGVLASPEATYQPAFEQGYGPKFETGIQQVGLVCSHFWNGRWHPREICVWVPQHRPYHHHRYPNFR